MRERVGGQADEETRRAIVKKTAFAAAAATGLATTVTADGSSRSAATPSAPAESDELTLEFVTTAADHGEEVGAFEVSDEFGSEGDRDVYVVARVSEVTHERNVALAFDTFVKLGSSVVAEDHQTAVTFDIDPAIHWEIWPAFTADDWPRGEYDVTVTFTDLIAGRSVTGTAAFSID